jgi:hypothetical protein
MPPENASHAIWAYAALILVWLLAVALGALCFRFPSAALIAPSYLLWSISVAPVVTGMPITIDIDIQPLAEVSICIGLGLLISRIFGSFFNAPSQADDTPNFPGLLLLTAIGIHLANYFWSFVAKMTLPGPFGAWLTENNPAYMFLTALDDDHIIFGGYPALTSAAFRLFDATHLYTNFLILFFQAAAVSAFFLPKRTLLALLIIFDVMHLSIFILAGANFWPWIILNVIIGFVVILPDFPSQPILLRAVATIFILIAPRFVAVASLGWFDSRANNKLSFEAVDRNGNRHQVPTNFFGFYSYALGHMDYGLPFPEVGLNVGSPNGGAYNYDILKASITCDMAQLARGKERFPFRRDEVERFVVNYQRMSLAIYQALGSFPYDVLYPHHFYVPASQGDDFRSLDKGTIVAYIYRQESVCLSFLDGEMHRKIVGSGDFRINVDDSK